MTAPDPRSRPARAYEAPLDGTATTRTDATVRPHDADAPDALEAWLESVTADGARVIGHVNGSSPHRSGANGSEPGESDTSLVATARQFHARIADAEASHVTDTLGTILETIIWERIMSSQFSQSNQIGTEQSAAIQGCIPPAGITRPRQQDVDASDPAPIIDRFTGGHPAISAVLAAAVLLAIVAIFRMVGAPPSGPADDPTTGPGSSTNPALAAASPNVSPVTRAAIPVAPENGTLLIDTGSGIESRPLDGSPGTTLETYDQLGPPTYIRTTVPDVVIGGDGKTAHNVRTGQPLGINPYDGSTIIGPFWVQYTSQNSAAPVDARIVDLRTMGMVEFFDLAGMEPVGLGPEWLIEGTESGTLGVGLVDRASGTGPTLTSTMLLIDGDLDRTRVVPLWSPRGTDGDVLAFSPDSSLVAYLTGTEGNVVIRVETTAGEPIGDIPWPNGSPVERLVLTDTRTLLIMAEGQVIRADLATGTGPRVIAEYTDEIWEAVLSLDGSHLLFATLDPLSGQSGQENTAWHWLNIGTGEVRSIPQATGGNRVWPGSSTEAEAVMLWVPVGGFETATYRVLFVDMKTGAVTVGQQAGVTSGLVSGQAISEDGTVFAAYGIGSQKTPRFRALDAFGSIPLNGKLTVFDAANQSVVEIPLPDSDILSEIISPALFVSPDGRHLVLSVRWTDAGGEHARSWITTTDGRSGWTPIEGGLVIGWVGE